MKRKCRIMKRLYKDNTRSRDIAAGAIEKYKTNITKNSNRERNRGNTRENAAENKERKQRGVCVSVCVCVTTWCGGELFSTHEELADGSARGTDRSLRRRTLILRDSPSPSPPISHCTTVLSLLLSPPGLCLWPNIGSLFR